MFDYKKLKRVAFPPSPVISMIRSWDKAGSQGTGCRTAGVLIGKCKNGEYVFMDVVKGQWDAKHREPRIKKTAESDGKGIRIVIEQEPGSGGKESAEATVALLAGWVVKVDKVTGDKALRAEPLSVQVEHGNVYVLEREWTEDFVKEFRSFPSGRFKDQVDAAASAFNHITTPYNIGVW